MLSSSSTRTALSAVVPRVRTLIGAALLLSLLLWGCAGARNRSEDELASAADVDPLSLHLELVDQFIRSNDYGAAVPLLRRVMTKYPDQALAHHYLGVILAVRKQYSLAEQEFRRALALMPDLAVTMDQLAVLLSKTHRIEEALHFHKAAVEKQPDNAAFHNNYAYTLFLSGRGEEAVAEYKRAIVLAPSSQTLYNNLGFAYGRLGKFEEAKRAFEQVGGSAVALTNLGLVYELMGRLDDAEASYKEALELDPGLGVASENLQALLDRKKEEPLPSVQPSVPPSATGGVPEASMLKERDK